MTSNKILGILCVVFFYQKNFLTGMAPLINKIVFKKLILQFFNLCFIISFIKFVAMILLQILKSIKKCLVSKIILLFVKKGTNTIGNFISNNVKGIRSSGERLKIFEYLKNSIHHDGFVFVQEKHLLTQDDFKDPLFFSHDSTNSCGVAIDFCGLKYLHIIDKKSDENGRILITDAKVNDEKFLLVNLYNSNTESEQIKTLDTLKNLLEDIDNISDKKIVLGGDLNLVFDCNLEACGGNSVLKINL